MNSNSRKNVDPGLRFTIMFLLVVCIILSFHIWTKSVENKQLENAVENKNQELENHMQAASDEAEEAAKRSIRSLNEIDAEKDDLKFQAKTLADRLAQKKEKITDLRKSQTKWLNKNEDLSKQVEKLHDRITQIRHLEKKNAKARMAHKHYLKTDKNDLNKSSKKPKSKESKNPKTDKKDDKIKDKKMEKKPAAKTQKDDSHKKAKSQNERSLRQGVDKEKEKTSIHDRKLKKGKENTSKHEKDAIFKISNKLKVATGNKAEHKQTPTSKKKPDTKKSLKEAKNSKNHKKEAEAKTKKDHLGIFQLRKPA